MNTLKFNNYIKNYNNGLTNMISELNLKTEGYCDKILTACYSEDFYESTDDADIILEEAKEGIIQRVIEFVRKIKNEIIGFIKKISNIVREKFFSAKSKEKFDKMDDIINTNPKIKGRKVKVKDTNKINKASNETLSEINGVKNKLSSGSITGAQASKEIDMIKEKHKKRMKIATTAVLTVGIGAALMFAKKNAKSISTSDNSPGVKDVDEGEKVIKQVANSAEKKSRKNVCKIFF